SAGARRRLLRFVLLGCVEICVPILLVGGHYSGIGRESISVFRSQQSDGFIVGGSIFWCCRFTCENRGRENVTIYVPKVSIAFHRKNRSKWTRIHHSRELRKHLKLSRGWGAGTKGVQIAGLVGHGRENRETQESSWVFEDKLCLHHER